MSHSVLGNIHLSRNICTFLPLEELPNLCKTHSALRRLTQTREAADQTLRAMLRTVSNANADVYARFFARLEPAGSPLRPLALIRQMPALRQLKVTTSDGRHFLIGLETLHNKQDPSQCDPHRLTSLDLAYQGPAEAVEFSALANYKQLQRLRISCPAINNATIDVLTTIPSLTEVGLLNCGIDSFDHVSRGGVRQLLGALPNLRSLTLGYHEPNPRVHISPDPRIGAAIVLAGYGKNLTSIGLHGNMDHPLEIVTLINSCPKLTFLDVTGSHFATRWTARSESGYSLIWSEVLAELTKARPNLQIKGPPKD